MFGAPLRDFCLRDVEEKPVVEGFGVKNPVPEEGVPGEGVPGEGVPGEGVPGEGVPGEGVPEEVVPEEVAPEEVAPEEVVPVDEEEELRLKCEAAGYVKPEPAPVEEFGNCNSHKKEGFSNRVLFGQRFLSLDLALRAVLYALLFYIVAHNDTQGLLKGVVKRLPKVVKPFAPMLLFGVLYYVLNLFI